MSYGLTYDTSTVTVSRSIKVCKFCGSTLTHYEDRRGCDYREAGEHYHYCECRGALAEQEKIKEQRKLDYEIKEITNFRQRELDEKYETRLQPTFNLDNLKYDVELTNLKSKYGKF